MTRVRTWAAAVMSVLVAIAGVSNPAFAADALNGADTAWILTSTALVLFMTLPGLALFYGGLVRSNNILSVLMHCFAICCVASVVWLAVGYSIAFSEGNAIIGDLSKSFLMGIGPSSLSGTIPETVFFMFQMTFAVITPALIVGAYPERVKFSAVLFFSIVWLVLVYAPVTHWVWGGGWLAQMGVRDFAGGIVVHVTAGVSALVFAKVLGSRKGFPDQVQPPHSPGLTMAGAAMLWVGWFGFNAGSALAADGNAGMAMTVTHIAAAVASLSWAGMEWIKFGKPSLVGIVTGMVAGLATITPASGFVGPMGAVIIGFLAGIVCQWMTVFIKQKIKIDDSLDVFAVHGVGGALGTLLVSFLALEMFQGLGLGEGMTVGSHLVVQVTGIVAVGVWSAIVSYILVKLADIFFGLRVSAEDESDGLDITAHGERGYEL